MKKNNTSFDKAKNMLLKQVKKIRIECEKEYKKETNKFKRFLIIDKYKLLTQPILKLLGEIALIEPPTIKLKLVGSRMEGKREARLLHPEWYENELKEME